MRAGFAYLASLDRPRLRRLLDEPAAGRVSGMVSPEQRVHRADHSGRCGPRAAGSSRIALAGAARKGRARTVGDRHRRNPRSGARHGRLSPANKCGPRRRSDLARSRVGDVADMADPPRPPHRARSRGQRLRSARGPARERRFNMSGVHSQSHPEGRPSNHCGERQVSPA